MADEVKREKGRNTDVWRRLREFRGAEGISRLRGGGGDSHPSCDFSADTHAH